MTEVCGLCHSIHAKILSQNICEFGIVMQCMSVGLIRNELITELLVYY